MTNGYKISGVAYRDVHTILGKDVHQIRVIRQHYSCAAAIHSCQLQLATILGEANALDLRHRYSRM